ncbi:hypothetical protein [Streptomonospora salina]|uniref:Ketosteroid isomerase-like protein n=1 Tax=Streptomonospora salina TaxID=104205 RepID=A0A841EDX6_9ACTN|nr:hypothetical protein [Streptomonospora salina]MBB5998650.1 ketosteroid isomerase-like protein [Streptomonospora salina]
MRPLYRALIPFALVLAAGTGCSAGESAETSSAEQPSPTAQPSSGPGAEEAAAETARTYVAAMEAGDGEAGCGVVSAEMRAALADLAAQEEGRDSCAAGFAAFAADRAHVGGMEVGEVTVPVDGETPRDAPAAHAEIVYPEGVDNETGMKADGFVFYHVDGAWVVDMDVR